MSAVKGLGITGGTLEEEECHMKICAFVLHAVAKVVSAKSSGCRHRIFFVHFFFYPYVHV